ncbi:hypothetical protein [Rhizobium sp. BK176]|uniref:hypothetical protein n=1 Tax=Rhizobium sp. BK176 TaxID=2587071 RepID=UPI002169270B|nr:hypothetical protein [Rhizobium sp. BK176]MCS4089632.1 hypothetical protein [Rhizobium sp. BK176]
MATPFKTYECAPNAAFAKRLLSAADSNPQVPLPNEGRLRWFAEKLAARGLTASLETVRRWLNGSSMPRRDAVNCLCQILGVDAYWMLTGRGPSPLSSVPRADCRGPEGDHAAELPSAVKLIASLIEMEGGVTAYRREGDTRALADGVDLHAILDGKLLNIQVAAYRAAEGFVVATGSKRNAVVGVKRGKGIETALYHLDHVTMDTKAVKTANGRVIGLRAAASKKLVSFRDLLEA